MVQRILRAEVYDRGDNRKKIRDKYIERLDTLCCIAKMKSLIWGYPWRVSCTLDLTLKAWVSHFVFDKEIMFDDISSREYTSYFASY